MAPTCSVWNAVPLLGHLWIPSEAALGVRLLAVDCGRPNKGLVLGLVDLDVAELGRGGKDGESASLLLFSKAGSAVVAGVFLPRRGH